MQKFCKIYNELGHAYLGKYSKENRFNDDEDITGLVQVSWKLSCQLLVSRKLISGHIMGLRVTDLKNVF